MTLSQRIAALSAPDRLLELQIENSLDIAKFRREPEGMGDANLVRIEPKPYLSSIDAALTLASPALQAHTMAEAQKLLGPRGFTVGKFTEALAIAICVVALREKGL